MQGPFPPRAANSGRESHGYVAGGAGDSMSKNEVTSRRRASSAHRRARISSEFVAIGENANLLDAFAARWTVEHFVQQLREVCLLGMLQAVHLVFTAAGDHPTDLHDDHQAQVINESHSVR